MNNNIIVIMKKIWPYKYVTWDRITMAFKQAVPKLKFPGKRSSIKPLNQELRSKIFI